MESVLEVPPLREVVAHAWFTMGYPPARSLVLVELEQLDVGEVPGFVARVDLPPPKYRRQVADVLAAAARRADVHAAVVLVVLDPGNAAATMSGRPMVGLVRLLRSRLRQAGVSVLDVVLLDAGRYRSLLCEDPGCCPPGGRALGDLATTRTAASMVLRGRTLVADEAELLADVAPDPWPAQVDIPPGSGRPVEDLALWRALVAARVAEGAGGPEPAAADVAWLVPALDEPRLRDAALVSLLPGTQRLARRLARGGVDGIPDLGAAEERPPDADRFEAGRALLAAVARGAPAGSRAEALAVLAWMGWWQGRGVRARLLAAMALQDRPGHRLAGLVDMLLLHGVPPSWARSAPMSPDEGTAG
jgi:hypothetical protein